jgi:hypothetical protein
VHGPTALAACRSCDPRAGIDDEVYTSAFWYGADFRPYLNSNGSPAGYAGEAWAQSLTFDIDREGNVEAALADARKLVSYHIDELGVPPEAITVFWSGAKGFAVELNTGLWLPLASINFPAIAREFCEGIASAAGVVIDPIVYTRVQPLRAPNSRHPKTGLHKRRIDTDVFLDGITAKGVLDLARSPEPFVLPSIDGIPSTDFLVARWDKARQAVESREADNAKRRAEIASGERAVSVNRLTRSFIAGEIERGERHRLLYSASRNLAEAGCPLAAIRGLLFEPADQSGLPPKDIEHGIACGFRDAQGAT